MKKQHIMMIGTLTLCGSLLVAVPSSFAVKSMDDKEMDRTTAAGQPVLDVGNGQQLITDDSLYTVNITLDGQTAIAAADFDIAVPVADDRDFGVEHHAGGGQIKSDTGYHRHR